MSKASATRDAWIPQTRQEREAILIAMQEVLASPHFCNSKRYPALLQYIVENTLAGRSDNLKERILGVEVFDRPPTYDTNADTVVRYTAGEVRKRLSLYYHEQGRHSNIRISLPAGSYVPEFLHGSEDSEELGDGGHHLHGHSAGASEFSHATDELVESGAHAAAVPMPHPLPSNREAGAGSHTVASSRMVWLVICAVVLLAGVGIGALRFRPAHPRTALDDFWAPVLRDQHVVPICTGGVVFSQNKVSGVVTAGKDIEYPFISLQSASAIAQISGLVERGGATTELQSAATTPLTELSEHPVVLVGGYNNRWTVRLLQPLHFYLGPDSDPAILDHTKPEARWVRDQSLPYSSADDYAVIARFHDVTTDSWVVALAGLGRNGTEAAAQFVSSPHYMQLLRDRIGSDYSNKNVEAVIKVSVIDGKTGAPSILTSYTW